MTERNTGGNGTTLSMKILSDRIESLNTIVIDIPNQIQKSYDRINGLISEIRADTNAKYDRAVSSGKPNLSVIIGAMGVAASVLLGFGTYVNNNTQSNMSDLKQALKDEIAFRNQNVRDRNIEFREKDNLIREAFKEKVDKETVLEIVKRVDARIDVIQDNQKMIKADIISLYERKQTKEQAKVDADASTARYNSVTGNLAEFRREFSSTFSIGDEIKGLKSDLQSLTKQFITVPQFPKYTAPEK